jgi:hypothetical protein
MANTDVWSFFNWENPFSGIGCLGAHLEDYCSYIAHEWLKLIQVAIWIPGSQFFFFFFSFIIVEILIDLIVFFIHKVAREFIMELCMKEGGMIIFGSSSGCLGQFSSLLVHAYLEVLLYW